MERMTANHRQLLLTLTFLLVLVPTSILAWFAFRTVSQEEMVQRRRLEDTLFLELDQTNSRIQLALEEMEIELYNSLPQGLDNRDFSARDRGDQLEALLDEWSENQDLAGQIFFLDRDRTVLSPAIDDGDGSNIFYWRYLNFFSGRESIPIYSNIVTEYQEEILLSHTGLDMSESLPEADEAVPSAPIMGAAESDEWGDALEETPAEAPVASSSRSALRKSAPADMVQNKEAESLFQSDTAVQERVYDLAEQEGQQYLERNVLPTLIAPREEETQTVVRSVYMESTRYFEEIIAEDDYGIIPRLFDSTFILLFWAKQGDFMVGCELDTSRFESRLAEAVSTPVNGIRYLNILDNGGRPLIPHDDLSDDQWYRPFVAKEISGLLPYWETAILLHSPEEFQRQIDSSRYFMTLLILLLGLLVFMGIAAIYQISAGQLRRVQQRVSFVTNVSHELKTPLTSIRMYSEMLAQGYQKDPEKAVKYSGYIAGESQRLTRLINNVLDFAKLEKGTKVLNLSPVDLTSLAEEAVEEHREEYGKRGVRLIFSSPPIPVTVLADREAVIQVIINLLSNGEKYSKEVKELTLEVGRENVKGKTYALLRVKDRGMGIARKHRKKIFREFYRVDDRITSSTGGTGLGLAIARNIMRNHGGELRYSPREKSDYRRGSVFTLVFPLPAETKENSR